MTGDYVVNEVSWSNASRELSAIRTRVFMDEQRVSAADEWDGKDQDAVHFLVRTVTGEAIATARILSDTVSGKAHFHIGRVAVLKSYRNLGIGSELMRNLIQWCLNQDAQIPIYLHAQTSRRTFYEKLGFIAQGTEFMDAGIAHISMNYCTEFSHEHPFQSQ